ncbi:hypothetical protein [Photobacterium leiognathi]|uniref:Uncharacterized protein n=1 Tax=Photobacterium leiognathi TaxID=553611 RepID=A0ABX5GEK6_PHOLE|nr:hypothetical protein [Photobacterium leiognathi]KJF89583.1 hypothetical protein UB42_12565 [Photobacterium leiognathi]PSV80987.1 hypothetical protein CTM94_13085 [Photobacterium leiognathi]
MTKLFSLSAIALLTSLSTAATAASLDVHGDIKINGKTVIDAKGNVIQDQSHLINIDDYANAAPNRVVTLTAPTDENGISKAYKIYYDETGREYKEDDFYNDKLVWSIKWEERTTTPLAHKRTVTKGSGDTTTTTSYKDEFTTSSSYPLAQIGVTMTRADIYTSEVLATDDPESSVGEITNSSDYQKLTIVDETSFKLGDTTIEECIIVTYNASWRNDTIKLEDGSSKTLLLKNEFRTFCKGYGLVQFGDYKATSAE